MCVIWQPEHELQKMTPFVREMHTKTGFIERVRASTLDLRECRETVLGARLGLVQLRRDFVRQQRRPRQALRRSLHAWARGLSRLSHPRCQLDQSARAACGTARARSTRSRAEGAHDAVVDIQRSIAELRHYRSTLFRSSV